MISKSNKFIKYASVAAIAIVALAASLSSSNINLSKNILRGRASETVNGSILFSKSTGSSYKIDNETFSISGKSATGATYYVIAHNSMDAFETSFLGVYGGMGQDYSKQYLTFSSNKLGTDNFEFQAITGIKITTNSSTNRSVSVYWSTTGGAWDWNSSSNVSVSCSSSPSKASFDSPMSYLAVKNANSWEKNIVSVELFYECSAVPTTISVKTPPTKVQYTEGDYFDPTGLVITVSYSDGSVADVRYDDYQSDFTFAPSLSQYLSTEDTSVTITYGRRSTSQEITVEKSSADYLEGTYLLDYDSTSTWKLTFYSNHTGIYEKFSSSGGLLGSDTFNYSLDGATINFTNVTSQYNNWGNYYLTYGTSSTGRETTATGTVVGNQIQIRTYSSSGTEGGRRNAVYNLI